MHKKIELDCRTHAFDDLEWLLEQSKKSYCHAPPFLPQQLAMIVLEIERIDEHLAWRSYRSNDLGQSGDGGNS
jgi:hypothetical protein